VLVGGTLAAGVGMALAEGLALATLRATAATSHTPPKAVMPWPLVCPAAVSCAK
jgi:hypothetical protein